MTKIALGKGLGALIPSDDTVEQAKQQFRLISLDRIAPNPMQPRQDFNAEKLAQLAESFKMNGILQPLVVRRNGAAYTIIAGERRYRAARLAGLSEVPAVIADEISETQLLEWALVENIQRENLNPIELAEAFRRLIDQFGHTQQQLADKVGRSRAAIANQLRLLTLPDDIKALVREDKLSEGHARALLTLDSEEEMRRMAGKIMSDSLSVREAERRTGREKGKRLTPKKKPPALVEVETYLKRLLGTSVRLTPGLQRGRIEIDYYSADDLTRLLELFRKIELT